MGRRLVIVGAIVAVLALAPAASATSQTASAGDVTATFSFKGNQLPNYRDEQLTISRAGVVSYNQPVSSSFCQDACAPGSEGGSDSSVHVVDLEHTGEPDVVLDLYTGGAHCCSVEQIFSFDPATATYVETQRNFGDPGMRIVDLHHDGHLELRTADDSFAYEFTDYAASGLPIQILTFSDGRFLNVTRSYPHAIERDAARWLRVFKATQRSGDTVGVIAAWAADEALLGHSKRVHRYLELQAKEGHLTTPAGEPTGKRFIAKLQRFLRAHGYRR
jgi:hypothetical protein